LEQLVWWQPETLSNENEKFSQKGLPIGAVKFEKTIPGFCYLWVLSPDLYGVR
jgi:hypothetical protein